MDNPNELDDIFGSVEIDDELWNDLEVATKEEINEQPEDTTTEEPEGTEEPEKPAAEEEPVEEPATQEEPAEEPSEEEFLTDESIFETYGEDVDPTLVRHYEVVKDYFLLSEDTKFDGKNLEALYEEDAINRNNMLAQKLLERLPDTYRTIVKHGIENGEDLTPETFDALLSISQQQLDNNYDPDNDDSVREYVRNAMLQSGAADASDVDDILETYSDKGKLHSIAEKYQAKRNEQLEAEKEQKVEQDRQVAAEARQRDQEFRQKINAAIDDTGYKSTRKVTLKKYIYDKTPDGDTHMISSLKHIYSNPEALIQLADLISYYNPKTGEWNIERFEKTAVTEATKKVKGSIEAKLSGSQAFKTSGRRKGKTDFDWDEVDV